jgi:hypothetical protein
MGDWVKATLAGQQGQPRWVNLDNIVEMIPLHAGGSQLRMIATNGDGSFISVAESPAELMQMPRQR